MITIEQLPDYPAIKAIQSALWHQGEVRGAAVMIGAGFSRNAERASPTSKAPPLWGDMAAAMIERLGVGSENMISPLRLAEEFRALLGQHALDGLVRDLVPDHQWLPGELHRRLLGLPWTDVLTTNWDTLLERAADGLISRSYDVVRTAQDIARTRSPRIVKLHGSLPSHTPFIFAEEDYRTYPVQSAAFVNLAQHVLLENELLLLGFSGDDPNFLAWTGWVRDQLGGAARKIRLAGILNLSPSRRSYLEALNVTPIDLSPLVADVHDHVLKHRIAAERLMQALEASAPKPVHEWAHFARIDNTAWDKTAPQVRVSNHIADMVQYRLSAPHTLVAPMVDRRRIRYWLSEDVQLLLPDLEEVELHVRGRLAAELAWRLDIGHFGVPDDIEPVLRAALHPDYGVDPEERLLILRLLGYNAIEHRQWEELQTFLKSLAAPELEPYDGAAWGAYLRCLAARENFDLAAIADNLDGVSGDDPVWSLRRAAMLCEVCESESAGLAIRDCLKDLSHRRGRDRKSLWLVSREC